MPTPILSDVQIPAARLPGRAANDTARMVADVSSLVSPMTVARLHDATRAALALAAQGDATWRWPSTAVEAEEEEFARAARGHKVSGLLAPYMGTLGFPPDLARLIRAQANRVMLRSLAQAGWMHEIHDRLRAAGIPVLFLKGLATEAQTGRAIGDRGSGDLDIWVPTDRVADAISVLRPEWTLAEGYPQPGPSWAWRHWMRWGREISLTGPVLVDLHWGLSGFSSFLPDFATAWAAREPVVIAGRSVPTLSREHALAHACRHAELDRWRFLRNLVDVSLLVTDIEAQVTRGGGTTLGVVDRAIGLPQQWSPAPLSARRWAEATEEHRHLGPHRQRTGALTRPAYLRRVLLTHAGRDPVRDVARLWWLIIVPAPHRLGTITTSSTVRGVIQGVLSRTRFEAARARARRQRRPRQ